MQGGFFQIILYYNFHLEWHFVDTFLLFLLELSYTSQNVKQGSVLGIAVQLYASCGILYLPEVKLTDVEKVNAYCPAPILLTGKWLQYWQRKWYYQLVVNAMNIQIYLYFTWQQHKSNIRCQI